MQETLSMVIILVGDFTFGSSPPSFPDTALRKTHKILQVRGRKTFQAASSSSHHDQFSEGKAVDHRTHVRGSKERAFPRAAVW